MREVFHAQLSSLAGDLADMADLAARAMDKATRALLHRDLRLAEQVITEDLRIDELRAAAENKAFALLALQAPVAGDLRAVVTALRAAGDIERMGDLALHVARAARRRHPRPVLPVQAEGYFAEMGQIAVALADKTAQVLRTRDLDRAAEMEHDDDAMDALHRHMFSVLTAPHWQHGVAPAIDITLLARFYERYADHAVSVARRVVYAVTGGFPQPLPR